jgi:hypothetical protein
LYVAFELGWKEWKLAFATAPADKPRLCSMPARDLETLQLEIAKAKKRFGLPEDAAVATCYEAGRDVMGSGESRRRSNLVSDKEPINRRVGSR